MSEVPRKVEVRLAEIKQLRASLDDRGTSLIQGYLAHEKTPIP